MAVTIHGRLFKLLEPREVGNRKWKVRDFVIQTTSEKGSQLRILQAEGLMLTEITKIPHGAEISCDVELLGKEVVNYSKEVKYKNLDVVVNIRCL